MFVEAVAPGYHDLQRPTYKSGAITEFFDARHRDAETSPITSPQMRGCAEGIAGAPFPTYCGPELKLQCRPLRDPAPACRHDNDKAPFGGQHPIPHAATQLMDWGGSGNDVLFAENDNSQTWKGSLTSYFRGCRQRCGQLYLHFLAFLPWK